VHKIDNAHEKVDKRLSRERGVIEIKNKVELVLWMLHNFPREWIAFNSDVHMSLELAEPSIDMNVE